MTSDSLCLFPFSIYWTDKILIGLWWKSKPSQSIQYKICKFSGFEDFNPFGIFTNFVVVVFVRSQILPPRLDWLGESHEQTYAELVSACCVFLKNIVYKISIRTNKNRNFCYPINLTKTNLRKICALHHPCDAHSLAYTDLHLLYMLLCQTESVWMKIALELMKKAGYQNQTNHSQRENDPISVSKMTSQF